MALKRHSDEVSAEKQPALRRLWLCQATASDNYERQDAIITRGKKVAHATSLPELTRELALRTATNRGK